MSGRGIKLYTDEDVDVDLAEQLQRAGYDVLSCRDADNAHRGFTDEWQLGFAVRQGRAILVHNTGDYVPLDERWRQRGEQHFGIILVEQLPIGELIRRVRHHRDTVEPQYQHNLVLYLAAPHAS
jgi:hypothetical protein